MFSVESIMYQQYGFLSTYDFLCPFFKSKFIEQNIDYKTILQNYAQSKKYSYVYDIIATSGPDHEKKFTCKLTVANMMAIGEGIGKKKAEKEAAKQFIKKYKILQTKKSEKKAKNQSYSISVERKGELNCIINSLRLNSSQISIHQLDEIFTHISYVNENKDKGIRDNSSISVVGDKVLSMLCCEYVFENYDIVNFSVKKNQLMHEDNLSRAISDKIVQYVLRTSTKNLNAKSCIRLKIDIIKSIIGMTFVNYITKRNNDISEFIKNYMYQTFAISAKDAIWDYTTFLQKVIQECGWSFSKKIKEEKHNNDNSYLYSSCVSVSGVDWIEKEIGFGNSKISSTNHAIKDILPRLLLHCSDEQMIYAEISRMINPELLIEYERKNQAKKISTDTYIATDTKSKTPNVEKKPIINEVISSEIVFDDMDHILYICKGTNSCRKKEHSIVSATGILVSLRGLPIKININYCIDCRLCFINLDEYKYYREKYGVLLGNISLEKLSGNGGYGYENLSNESILRMFGYTVNQTDNLSADNRRKILAYMMDRDIVSKYRIIEYLQFFIKNSRYRYNLRIANQKWSDDLNWVRTYNIDKQKKYLITSIKKY